MSLILPNLKNKYLNYKEILIFSLIFYLDKIK